ncbi:MAG: hypothetical protein EBU30_13065 [Synechococcaceae bacterium WB6_3B_236]|jgi:hypothetical protein|nr:hypothetical protein [Synechococcaceae bacterium WB6_3B_236]
MELAITELELLLIVDALKVIGEMQLSERLEVLLIGRMESLSIDTMPSELWLLWQQRLSDTA